MATATAAVERQRRSSLGLNKIRAKNARQSPSKKRGQVLRFTPRATQQSALPETPGELIQFPGNQARSIDNEQMYNQGTSPENRAQLEAQNRAKLMQDRNSARIRAQQFKMPKELMEFTEGAGEGAQRFVNDMYEKELENRGMDTLLDKQLGRTPLNRAKNVLNKEKARMQKAATDAVKKQAKEALKKAFKDGLLKGGKKLLSKTFWSGFAQGSIVEVEGAMLESWFGTGTTTGMYQSLITILHGGKKLMGEKGPISWIEPDAFQLPSQNFKLDARSLATSGGTNILLGIYDMFGLVILTPMYAMLAVIIFILVNLIVMLIVMPYAMAYYEITYLIDLLGL